MRTAAQHDDAEDLGRRVTGYIVRRLWQSVLVLFAVSLLSFVLIFLSGEPVAALVPRNARAEDMDKIRHQYSLDQPLPVQYVLFLVKATSGDLGESFRYRTAALPLVLGQLPTTLLLAAASVVLSTLISLPLGVLAATRKGRLADAIASFLALLAISMPSFWLGGSGGWVDALIMRLVDIQLSLPGVLLAVAILAAIGKGLFNVVLVLGFVSLWPGLAILLTVFGTNLLGDGLGDE